MTTNDSGLVDDARQDEIRTLLARYFDVLQTQDMVEFDDVFMPGAVLYSSQSSELTVRSISEYRRIVETRPAPASMGAERRDEVLFIDALSSEMALAKVRLWLNGAVMVDYLNLLRVDGRWRVAAKLYHRSESVTDVVARERDRPVAES